MVDSKSLKKNLNIVFCGHVDAGKSTISGHLMYLTGQVDERTMEKYEREAKLVAQLPEAAPFTKHGSVPCRGALDHARPHAPCFRRRRG